jgi:hypothetical protein
MKITPFNNNSLYIYKEIFVEFYNFKEIGQGGPEVCKIKINSFPKYQEFNFSLPFLSINEILIIPVFIRNKFDLCKIDFEKNTLEVVKLREDLILLKNYQNGEIIYFIDLENNIERKLNLDIFIKKNTLKILFDILIKFYNRLKSIFFS